MEKPLRNNDKGHTENQILHLSCTSPICMGLNCTEIKTEIRMRLSGFIGSDSVSSQQKCPVKALLDETQNFLNDTCKQKM